MIKKVLILLTLFGITFFQYNYIGMASEDGNNEKVKICDVNPENKINCSKFEIKTEIFSPGSKNILNKAKEGGGDTVQSANAILGVIIKNLIVIFGVISLFMMTIGGGMMIFHSGQDSILTKGKGVFTWGIVSLIIALSSGIIVQIVTYILY